MLNDCIVYTMGSHAHGRAADYMSRKFIAWTWSETGFHSAPVVREEAGLHGQDKYYTLRQQSPVQLTFRRRKGRGGKETGREEHNGKLIETQNRWRCEWRRCFGRCEGRRSCIRCEWRGRGCRRCEWRGSLNYPGDCLKQGSGHRKNMNGSYSPA